MSDECQVCKGVGIDFDTMLDDNPDMNFTIQKCAKCLREFVLEDYLPSSLKVNCDPIPFRVTLDMDGEKDMILSRLGITKDAIKSFKNRKPQSWIGEYYQIHYDDTNKPT